MKNITDQVLNFAKIAALASVVFVCVAAGLLLLEARSLSRQMGASAQLTLAGVNRTVTESDKAVHDLRLTIDNVNRAAIAERLYFSDELPRLGAKTEATLDATNAVLGALRQTADGLRANDGELTAHAAQTLDAATASVARLQQVEDAAAHAVSDVDALVNSADVKQSLANVDRGTARAADAADATAKTLVDVQQEVHSMTHPKPLVSIANWTLKVIHAAGGWF